jgi:hypothetical protein
MQAVDLMGARLTVATATMSMSRTSSRLHMLNKLGWQARVGTFHKGPREGGHQGGKIYRKERRKGLMRVFQYLLIELNSKR